MKKFLLPLILLLVSIVCLQAQNVPFGMKYQAVARDAKGVVLAEKEISLQIKLLPNGVEKKAFYTETHKVTTNKIGLFSLTVGDGTVVKGAFKDIPWDKSEVWMSIGLDEYNDGGYVLISNSKLLAVPYAMHSLTAERLAVNADSSNDGQDGDKAGAFWKLTGNLFTLPPNHFVGTRDNKELIFKTNNINRMEITASGDIAMANDLDVGGSVHIGENLVVDQNVTLNDVGGMTNNKGKFTVSQGSPTMLTGTLMVDGTTDLNSSLDVNNASPTNLTGTLNVDGTTDLNSSLDVNNASPTNLTGTLNVDLATDLNNTLTVDGATDLNNTLNVDGTTDLNSSLDVNNASPTHLTGTLTVDGVTTLNNNLNVTKAAGAGHVAHFENTSNGNGIEIKVGAATPHNNNNFITFLNSADAIVGRIEGEDGGTDYANNREYQDDLDFFDTDVDFAIANIATATADLVLAGVELVGASTSSTVCGGLGACVTAPVPSLIVAAAAGLVVATANEVIAIADLVKVQATKSTYVDTHEALKGITFASGAEDYAEYLPKRDLNESFARGEVVGMKNGFITKNTTNADRIMVISFKPAVLGGLPIAGEEHKYEKVAFLGQIPTRVMGKVNKGDYILPSGFHNGLAIGKNPADMLLSDYKKILGMAWEDSKNEFGGLVNVAVGLNVNDLATVVEAQKEEITALKQQINQTNTILADLVPGFREAANVEATAIVETNTAKNVPQVHTEDDGHDHQTYESLNALQPTADDIIYYTLTREDCLKAINSVREAYTNGGAKIADHPFWNRLATDTDYTEELIGNMIKKFNAAIHFHQELNAASQK